MTQLTTLKNMRLLVWLALCLFIATFFILIQTPVQVIINKFAPNNGVINNAHGTIWQGNAAITQPSVGQITWQWRPIDLLRLQWAYHIKFNSSDSRIALNAARSLFGTTSVSDVNGNIGSQLLKKMYGEQWPNAGFNIKQLMLAWNDKTQFLKAQGQVAFDGGAVSMSNNGQNMKLDIPPSVANFSAKDNILTIEIEDAKKAKLVEFILTPDNMVEVKVRQRALQSLPQYQGNPNPDLVVVTLKQPIAQFTGKGL